MKMKVGEVEICISCLRLSMSLAKNMKTKQLTLSHNYRERERGENFQKGFTPS